MASLMLKSCIAESQGKPVPAIVDLGYWSDGATRRRWDCVRAFGLGRHRGQLCGHRRLLVEIPPKRLPALLAELPIVEGSTYWRATHHWRGLGGGERKARTPAKYRAETPNAR